MRAELEDAATELLPSIYYPETSMFKVRDS